MKVLLAIFLFIISDFSKAAINFEDAAYPELITSGRALAMGNAFTSKVDDHHSVFYNPAGLGTFRKWHFHFANFHIESNKDLLKMSGGGKITSAASNITKAYSLDGVRELLLENRGKLSHARLNFFPNITTRYFSMGYMYSYQQRATIGGGDDAKFEYARREDQGPVVSMNASLFGGIIKFGASAIYLARKEAIGEANKDTKIELQGSDFSKGRMFYLVAGTRLTLPWEFLPTFSATIHNASNSNFSPTAGGPQRIRQNSVFGFSITPQIGRSMRVHLEANYKDASDKYGVDATRRLGLGMEIDFARTFFMRLGYGDGYGSGGIGIKSRKLEVDVTTYAVDTTTSGFRGKEDRRFVLSISRGF